MNVKDIEHWLGAKMTFGLSDRVSLYNRLGRFAKNGIPVSTSIQNMLTRYNKRKDMRAEVFSRIHKTILAGRTIEDAFRPYLPPAELQLISAGETSGQLAQGFDNAKFVAISVSRMKGALIGQMVYPAVLLILLTLILWMLATNLMPILESMLDVSKWPGFSQVLKHLADWLVNNGLEAVVGFVCLLAAAIWSLPRWTGDHPWSQWSAPIRSALDKFMPPYNIYREYQASTFLIALGALMSSGTPVDEALGKISRVATKWTSSHLDHMRKIVQSGKLVSSAMRTGMVDQETADEIEDYESANALEETLANIGEETIERSIKRLDKMGMVIRLVMLLMVVGMIIWIYASLVFVIMKVASESKRGF